MIELFKKRYLFDLLSKYIDEIVVEFFYYLTNSIDA